ncbi:MAG: class I SAM-dependent methyltransferase [Caulobacteraceae bacterium]
MKVYDEDFYADQEELSAQSAREVVPYIIDAIRPESVLDVGCGKGTWAAEFARCGVDAYGIDGPWAEANTRIPGRLITYDFGAATGEVAPALPKARFDLVTTFEFLEHIDGSKARDLVRFLTSLSDVVIAGAAIPDQGGAHHVNEQWPAYWRDLFAEQGFVAYDFLRPAIWGNTQVEPWYAQNSIGYFRGSVPQDLVEKTEALALAALRNPPALVHPTFYSRIIDRLTRPMGVKWHLEQIITRSKRQLD